MPQRIEERVRPITPQLAWRVAVLGGIAFVLFGIVFFRLWYLQVLTGQEAVRDASDNRVRKVRIEAPRGNIVDRNNVALVRTKIAAVVQMIPSQLPKSVRDDADAYRKQLAAAENQRLLAQSKYDAFRRQLRDDGHKVTKHEKKERSALRKAAATAPPVAVPAVRPDETELIAIYKRMGRVLQISPKTIHKRIIRGIADAPYSNVTIRTDVPRAQFNHMKEYSEDFPGVVVEERYQRNYPHTTLAAQLFGRVFEIGPEQRKEKKYEDVAQGTRIGQSGLELKYDQYLRGTDGFQKLVVDAFGSRDDQRPVSVKEPKQGQRLKLTLDYNLQKKGDEALAQAIAASHWGAKAGAYVAMDPRDGEILAMGSQPSFDANDVARPFDEKLWKALTSQATGAPLLNRATDSAYPIGSTFKPITALASLEAGLIKPNDTINDDGHYELGPQKYQNAKAASFGTINISDALKVSSDVFFYRLGEQADSKNAPIQRWAKRFGFGRLTGIDLPGELPGLVPDSNWRAKGFAEYEKCRKRAGLGYQSQAALYACGGIDRQWTTGDSVNLAVGQGDLQATPLQVAVAYSALANGGTVVKPHLGKAIEDGNGVPITELPTKPGRKTKVNAHDRQVVLEGLRRAASEDGGTSADLFKNFPYKVYGKTGTVERQPNPDQAWYACFVKDGDKPIVVVVTVERGGFGAETAAPAARLILSQWLGVRKDLEFKAGSDQSN
jgi:penicillin-binding protein 2